ncbi:MAG TPA: ABC transporter permease [Bryobacteraceae bacterium]|jgi:predicted permease|nr:ABC transporter permease [Bryobacteraceae bacterium]
MALSDLKFAIRAWRRSPAFVFIALVASALGIGAATAVFSATDRILFRPLPYRADTQLVSFGISTHWVLDGGEFLFAADYKDLFDYSNPFQSMTSWSGVDDCDITSGTALRQRCAEVDSSFLPVLGVQPVLGHNFSREDTRPGATRSVLLSYGLWLSRFAGDPHIAGRTLSLDGAPARILGVLPPSFELPTLQHADLLVPQIIQPAGWSHNGTRVLRVIGRLKPGLTLAAARAQLQPFFEHIRSEAPPQFRKELQFQTQSMREHQLGSARLAATTLLGAVLAVLLISCANVANLLLARAAGRRTEFAIRAALGITRSRLARQMLTESLLLSLTGGLLGCGLAAILLRFFIRQNAGAIPHLQSASLDLRVLAFCFTISIGSGLLFGLAPALLSPRLEDLTGSRGTAPRSSMLFKNGLVSAQIALSIVLLSSAGLLVRSLWKLETQPLGMATSHIVTAELVLPASRYTKPEERVAFFNQLEQRLRAIPGIRAVGLSDSLPPAGWERSRPLSVIQVAHQATRVTGSGGLVLWRYVSPGYFDAFRIPVIAGRSFTEDDRRRGANLAILSESLARRLFPTHNAIGQQLSIVGQSYEIAGIVPDVKNTALTSGGNPEYYILRGYTPDHTYRNGTGPIAQRTLSIVLRGDIPDSVLAAIVKQKVAQLDSSLPVEIRTMHARLGELAAAPRFQTILLLSFALIGLLLAAIGLYGTISYLVTQRTQEIGIRMSLGATPANIAAMMLAYSARWTSLGVAAGLCLSFFATRLLQTLLFGVSSHDAVSLIAAILFLIAVALLAATYPARRAARIDPMIALRHE